MEDYKNTGDYLMTTAEKKISNFCVRRKLGYEWQRLKYEGQRAVIVTLDRVHHDTIWKAAHRLKGIRVTERTCYGGGCFEGFVYLQDAVEADRIDNLLATERERCENWNRVFHDALVCGLDHASAARRAEALYPTPTPTSFSV